MQTIYIGNTLINDVMLGSQRMDDVLQAKPSINIEYLVVAAGGRGGQGTSSPTRGGGGAGAGGLLSGSAILFPGQTYYVQVGGFDTEFPTATNGDSYLTGSNFYFYSLQGGDGGGTGGGQQSGGSGGGANRCTTSGCTTIGASGTPGQGNGGGNGSFTTSGAGGGADSAASGTTAGTGRTSSISGTSVTYSTGGAAAAGGDGALDTGNGGNGGQYVGDTRGKWGGSGIVYIRYRGPQAFTGGTVTTDGDFTVHKFNTIANDGNGTGSEKTNYSFTYN